MYLGGDRGPGCFEIYIFQPYQIKFISGRARGRLGDSESKLPDTDGDGGLSCPLQVISTKQFHTDFLLAGDRLCSSSFLGTCPSSSFNRRLYPTHKLQHRFVRAKQRICSASERGCGGLHEKTSLKAVTHTPRDTPACTGLRWFVSKSKTGVQQHTSNCPRTHKHTGSCTLADTCEHTHAHTPGRIRSSLIQRESKLKNRWDLCHSNGCRFLKCCQSTDEAGMHYGRRSLAKRPGSPPGPRHKTV